MPLAPPTLLNSLRSFIDSSYEGFIRCPASEPEAAEAWANAIKMFMLPLAIPPPVNPARHELAARAMMGALTGMSKPGQGLIALQRGLTAYAGVIVANSAPISLPPPPIVLTPFSPVIESLPALSALVSTIAAWVITGTFTIPPAPPVPWG